MGAGDLCKPLIWRRLLWWEKTGENSVRRWRVVGGFAVEVDAQPLPYSLTLLYVFAGRCSSLPGCSSTTSPLHRRLWRPVQSCAFGLVGGVAIISGRSACVFRGGFCGLYRG